jgi:homoserine trans-succinylase
METEILEILSQISWAGVAGLFMFYVLRPIFERIFNGGIYKKVNEIEKNHLSGIEKRLDILEERVCRIEEELIEIEKDIGWLKGKINQND